MNARLINIEKGVVEFSAKEQITGKKEDLDQLTRLVALNLREHFGEKVERPHSAAQSSQAAPPPAKAYSPDDNIPGLVVKEEGGHEVRVVLVTPDRPCKGIIKPGDLIYSINPHGPTLKGASTINRESDFNDVVSGIKPGTKIAIRDSHGIAGKTEVIKIPE